MSGQSGESGLRGTCFIVNREKRWQLLAGSGQGWLPLPLGKQAVIVTLAAKSQLS